MLNGETVLVTGATGKVAFPIARALVGCGNRVYGMARFSNPAAIDRLQDAGIEPVRGDLHLAAFDGLPPDITYVFHAGAALDYDSVWEYDLEVNALSTGRLMLAVAESCRGFVYCSTGSVYQHQGRPLREDDPPGAHWTSNYAFSKIAGEAIVRHISAEHGVPATIIRIFSTYGPEGGMPWNRIAKMLAGEPVRLHTDRPNHFNPIFEDDYVRLGIRALEVAAVPTITVNWSGSETVTAEDYLAYAASLTGATPTITYDEGAHTQLWADVTKMHSVLGRCEVPWQEGFRRTIEALAPDRLL
jgi:nucleoside-diphosphate-sugar epimerase